MPNFISQSRIFADFGATAGGSAGGAVWLQNVMSMKVTDDRSTDVIKAIGVDGGAGFRRKTGGGTISLTENRVVNPIVDWRRLRKEGKQFMIMAQDEQGGVREKWLLCMVSKVDRSLSDEGEHQDEIEIKFLQSYTSQ